VPSGTSGFSLVELTVALALFALVGYALLCAIDSGRDCHQAVMRAVSDNEMIRETAGGLRNELRVSSDDVITVETLGDLNHQVTFMLPILVGGALAWGVYDQAYGADEELRTKEDWSVRYTSRMVTMGPGPQVRALVRQILDDEGEVFEEEVLVPELRGGDENPPGFTMIKSGDLWEITITTVGRVAATPGARAAFHVRTRN